MKRKLIEKLLLFFFVFFLLSVSSVQAAYLKFDKDQVNVAEGGEFDLQLIVDPEGEEITSIDAYIQFDKDLIEGISVTEGSYFPTVTNNIAASNIYVAGMVDDPANPKTGTGTVVTVKFKGKANANTTISFNCDSSKIIKNDINSTNIIACNKNKTAEINIGQGSTNNQTNSGSSNSGNSTGNNAQLPKTGVFDNTEKLFLPGAMLFVVGILGRFLLKF